VDYVAPADGLGEFVFTTGRQPGREDAAKALPEKVGAAEAE
jgi:hypothetical protein